jgi:DNA modification methylase
MTEHKLIIGDCTDMGEIADESIQLVVTSPPYFNAPFDYKGYYKAYSNYLDMLKKVARELYRVVAPGRIVALNIDDMLIDGKKYPIVADATKFFLEAGFDYRDRIIWKKPDGYLRISRRSGVLLQNPYPMYFYPDNLLESILIFQKGEFDYKSIPKEIREKSKIDIKELEKNSKDWYKTLWEMTNVLPNSDLEKGIAAFPEELPRRLIILYSYVGETVLDPFVGSGTTMKVARSLNRNSIGIEINKKLVPIIKKKLGFDGQKDLLGSNDTLEIIFRETETVEIYGTNSENH